MSRTNRPRREPDRASTAYRFGRVAGLVLMVAATLTVLTLLAAGVILIVRAIL